MRRIKRIAYLFLVFTLLLSLVACGGSKNPVSDVDSTDESTESTNTGGSEMNDTNAPGETTTGSQQGDSTKATAKSPGGATTTKKAVKTSAAPGTTAPPKPKTSLTRDQVIAKMPSNLKGTTLTYMYWWDPRTQMEGEAIEKFEKATGIKFNPIVASYSDFQTQLSTKIQAGESPDLVRLLGNVSWQITTLQPITNSGFDFNDTAWDEQLMKDYTFNGRCYAANLNDSAISDVAVIYYNIKALQDAEMQDPYDIWTKNPKDWTWEKFWSMCEEFVAANKGKSGYAGATFEYVDGYARALGGSTYYYDSSKGMFVNNMLNPATEAGWKTILQAVEKGLMLQKHDETKFDQGKVLFFWSGPFSARTKDNRQKALKERNRLGVVPLPVDSKYQVMYEYTAFGIPVGAKNAAAAPYYLRYVLDKSSYNMDGVYYNAKARKVLDYACSLKNRFYGVAAGTSDVYTELFKAGSSQVKSVLNSYNSSVQTFIDAENERIKYFAT